MLKRLAKCIREYKLPSFLSALFVSLEVVMEVLIPFEMADMLDHGINAGDMDFVIQSGIRLVIFASLVILFGNLAGRAASTAACGFGKNLRHDMYYNIQNFSFSNIDKFSTSSLITRMTTDVQNVQQAYLMLVRTAFRSPIMMVFSTVFAFRIYPKLAIVFVACLPILMGGLYFIMTKTHPIFKRVFKTYDRLNRTVQENLRGIRVVKSFIREDHESEKFDETSESIRRDFTRAEQNIAWNAPLMQSCSYACMLLVSWLGAKAIIASGNNPDLGLTTGMLMSLITYSMQILMSVMMISVIFVMITISRESAERICEVLNEESNLKNNEHPVFEIPDGSVKFEHVTFRYSEKADKNVLNDICLEIKSGETVGILGGTGSSKSTLVQMIPRLYDATEGSVLVGGKDVREYDLEALRDSVAMVLQKNVLFSGTVRENLLWGNEHATQEEIEHACELAQAAPFINEMPEKYETYIEQGGANVSGGQKQRLCIARALLKKPKILILDDSTSAVDTKTDALIRKAFAEEIPDTTKIIIAQRVASVMDSDKIIILDAGKIVAMGTHEELMETSEIYRETYESQMKGGLSDE
ncbi:MAG: ABC transporter ATP-binding protein [Oscillospiraceae bacterium]|nr:ABC transporter ATP-binding protein [Oscillospiraceae bacterium]MBQ8595826.1 ABC transporter ATP-binding protein [Oscillospiraceae bacterium]